jgi:hypothetical protein
MVNTADLKSVDVQTSCRFESGHRHPDAQGISEDRVLSFDTHILGMHDKSMTDLADRAPERRPFLRVKRGSIIVPVCRNQVRGYFRYTVAFWLNHKRVRRTFADLEAAKTEARLAA